MPGMWTVADLRCPQCGAEFWGDLPAGWGLYHPCLVDKRTREVHDPGHSTWWANLHRRVAPIDMPVGLEVEQFRPVRRPVVLNCLDWLYGHCVLKLINAQYYIDRKPDFDLIVIVPKLLRWMVPEGAAEVWAVDVPLRRGSEWNEWLGREFRRRLEPFPEAWLSLAFSHPHPSTFDIEALHRRRPVRRGKVGEQPNRPGRDVHLAGRPDVAGRGGIQWPGLVRRQGHAAVRPDPAATPGGPGQVAARPVPGGGPAAPAGVPGGRHRVRRGRRARRVARLAPGFADDPPQPRPGAGMVPALRRQPPGHRRPRVKLAASGPCWPGACSRAGSPTDRERGPCSRPMLPPGRRTAARLAVPLPICTVVARAHGTSGGSPSRSSGTSPWPISGSAGGGRTTRPSRPTRFRSVANGKPILALPSAGDPGARRGRPPQPPQCWEEEPAGSARAG